MKTNTKTVEKLIISDIERLDPVIVISETLSGQVGNQGVITITCYGKAWTAFFGGIGARTIEQFICSCDEHYLAKKLSDIDSQVYDIDALEIEAEKKEVAFCRDDPWNDYEFMSLMYGDDMMDWADSIPKEANPDYIYLCRIIKAVQEAFAMREQE